MSSVLEMALLSTASPVMKSAARDLSDASPRARSGTNSKADTAVRIDASLQRIVDQVSGTMASADRPNFDISANLAPGSARYSMFVDAVQALRLDKSTAAELTPERVAELKAAAAEIFQIRTGIPREQSPVETLAEQRALASEKDARAEAARAKASEADVPLDVVDADRAPGATALPASEAEVTESGAKPEAPSIPEPVVANAVPDEAASPAGTTGVGATNGAPEASGPIPDVGGNPAQPAAPTPSTSAAEPSA